MVSRDVLEGGKGGGGGLKGGFGWEPSSEGPPMVPAEGGPSIFKHKSSWCRSKNLAVSLKHRKGRGGVSRGGGGAPPPPAVYGRSNTSLMVRHDGLTVEA